MTFLSVQDNNMASHEQIIQFSSKLVCISTHSVNIEINNFSFSEKVCNACRSVSDLVAENKRILRPVWRITLVNQHQSPNKVGMLRGPAWPWTFPLSPLSAVLVPRISTQTILGNFRADLDAILLWCICPTKLDNSIVFLVIESIVCVWVMLSTAISTNVVLT